MARALHFLVEAPAFMWGKKRFSAPVIIMRFSAGIETSGAKALLKSDSLNAGLKSSFPLLKQGAPTKKPPPELLKSSAPPPEQSSATAP